MQPRKGLIVAQEAGAGALLAALISNLGLEAGSAALTSPLAGKYFTNTKIPTLKIPSTELEIEHLILHLNPSVVITGASVGNSIEKKITKIAQRLGIMVDTYIDHYWNLWQRFADPVTAKRWVVVPDRIFVPDLLCADKLRALGCPVSAIKKYDNPLLKIDKKNKVNNFRRYGDDYKKSLRIPMEATVVLFVSEYLFDEDKVWQWDQPLENEFEELLTLLLSISADKGLIYVLVRCHPNESKNRWNYLYNRFAGANWVNVSEMPKNSLFAISDFVFGLNSMLLLEAAAHGIPVYSYHSTDRSSQSWLSRIRPEINELNSSEDVYKILMSIARV
jgi:hypothetical protein